MTPDAPTPAGPSAFRISFNAQSPEPPAPIFVPASAPLSPLSDLSPSPPLHANFAEQQRLQPEPEPQPQPVPQEQTTPRPHAARTRQASGASTRPSLRLRDAANAASPVAASQTQSVRRIRPLAPSASNNQPSEDVPPTAPRKGSVPAPVVVGSGSGSSWGDGQQPSTSAIEFPPRHVVLHSDDAGSKVFAAMYRAFMSVDNRAMTVKDLADLSMKHGLFCQNASAAGQALTFFIRCHLHRCEAEDDFPLLLRLVLSGTLKDDDLAPALYSRLGGNVNNKDKPQKDENGKECPERLTSFRRGTVVWYLSKAAGAPCPFARAGLALRNYTDSSAITGGESRKGLGREGDAIAGLKRKREGLRRRLPSGAVVDEDSAAEDKKPPKVKLMLRLKPFMTSMREKTGPEGGDDSSSDSDSDSGSETGTMDVDSPAQSKGAHEAPVCEQEQAWIFPPYPIQRRISIPPYTPSEETYSMQSPYASTSNFEWRPKLELHCVDDSGPPVPGMGSYYNRDRAASVPFSIASPPPESDDDFTLDDDEDDEMSFTMSPEIPIKREEDAFSYVWPQAASSSTSLYIKPEPVLDDGIFKVENESTGAGSSESKRSSTHTIKDMKREELDFDFGSLSLNFEADTTIKQEDVGFGMLAEADGSAWCRPVDLTHDEPVCGSVLPHAWTAQEPTKPDWRNVQLLGPDSVCIEDLEDGGWDSVANAQIAPEPQEESSRTSSSMSPDAPFRYSDYGSPGSPPSLAESGQAWSAGSPETDLDSAGPASPPSMDAPESPVVIPHDHSRVSIVGINDLEVNNGGITRSAPWTIPGKTQRGPTVASRSDTAPSAETGATDVTASESGTPWERGMVCADDIEEHLREPSVPPLDMRVVIPSSPPASTLSPLTPQEEAVFQSFCMYPDAEAGWDDEPASAGKEAVDAAQVIARAIQASSATDVPVFSSALAAATRPPRGRRPAAGKRVSMEKRERAYTDGGAAAKANADADAEESSDDARAKDNKDAAAKGPLRRSRRVANAVATQRNRERLRKRTGTA